MASPEKYLIAGNWKMNGTLASLSMIDELMKGVSSRDLQRQDIMLCPPFTLLSRLIDKTATLPFLIGAQDCHMQEKGAHTGDISAAMLRDLGTDAVIVGHSERRADHGETNEIVQAKAESAHAHDLTAIICIGETLDQREAGQTLAVVSDQLTGSMPALCTAANTVIAYEPVWAIGTGKVPSNDDIALVHQNLREILTSRLGEEGERIHLLYGGSVKGSNAADILSIEHVNGALVGGASLTAKDFLAIIKSVPEL
jgi:triosephosphate isomerase